MNATFEARLEANRQDLEILFFELYGNRPNAANDFKSLIERLQKLDADRDPSLKKLDIERDQSEWMLSNKHVGMALYVDRFAGKLNDLNQKLPYLEDLGINFLHLMPIMDRPAENSDGGYAVTNFLKVDKQFGTNGDLKKLSKSLKSKGMNLMLDFVMNHTADNHSWAMKAKKGNKKYQDYYCSYDSRTIPDAFELNLMEVFPETSPGNFTFSEEMQRWVHTTFYWFQWDLNYKNSFVFVEMVSNLIGLINFGVDIIRMDAPAFVWKELGGTSQNLDQVHKVLALMKVCTKIVAPGSALLSEAIVAPYEIMKYYGTGDRVGKECDLCYNALTMALLWDTVATQNATLLKTSLEQMPSKPYGTTWLNYVRSHDDIGLGYDDSHIQMAGYDPHAHRQYLIQYYTGGESMAKGEKYMYNPKTGDARISGTCAALVGLEKAVDQGNLLEIELRINQYLMLHSIILSLGGIPMLYYGDEFASFNNMAYLNDPNEAIDNRWMHRPLYDWSHLEKIEQPHRHEHKIFHGLKNLIALRKALPEFGDFNNVEFWDFSNKHLLVFKKGYFEDETLVIVNVSGFGQPIRVDQVGAFNLGRNLINGTIPFEYESSYLLKAYEFMWLKK